MQETKQFDWGHVFEELMKDLPEEAIEIGYKENTKKGYDTVGYKLQYLIDRMNTVIGEHWDMDYKILYVDEIKGTRYNKYTKSEETTRAFAITVDVTLKVNGVTRSNAGDGFGMRYGAALKAAISNGLKRAFSLFSLGRKAYTGELETQYLRKNRSTMTGGQSVKF